MKAKKSLLIVLSLIFICIGFADKANAASVTDTSISGELAGMNTSKLIIVPAPNGGTAQEYDSNAAGLKAALYDLYQYGNNQDFAMYIGTNITTVSGADAKSLAGTPSATNMTFSALEGKVKNLVITATTADMINDNTTLPTGAKYLTFAANAYMGTNVIFRNVDYRGTNLYMNGHDLSLNGGSYGNGFNLYGGSDNSDVTGSPTITINSTGSGTWNLYGGNNTGGTLTGNPTIKINDASGQITTIAGGGSAGNIAGDISTTINAAKSTTALTLKNVYGASLTGNVSGTVTNKIAGYGKWSTNDDFFYGGSQTGNIGTDRAKNAITTDFDTSLFSSGSASFIGGNRVEGTIIGSIDNTIKAGTNNKGSIESVSGGTGINGSRLTSNTIGVGADSNQSNYDKYDALTPDARAELAKNNAKFKVFGNITNVIRGGQVSQGGDAGYTRAAGYAGYIEGNTSVVVGTKKVGGGAGGEGFVYSRTATNLGLYNDLSYIPGSRVGAPSTKRTENSNYDIVGGGGTPGARWSIYIKGDSKTIHNNVLARWTYGGSFSGVNEGNTYIELNDGLVDTLEGGGYDGQRIFGNATSIMNSGEMNFFFSGGGWDDDKIYGDVTAVVYDGVVNGSLGGSYGASYGGVNGHTVIGNADVTVLGGDFSGYPSHGTPGFSGGVTNLGTLTGNAKMTIDLRKSKGFSLPNNTQISAGRPYDASASNSLGTSEENTVELNIYTAAGENVLNGAQIYGDGGAREGTKSGKITVNIDAPDSSIGNLYTTQYSNIYQNKMVRDVDINVQRIKSINGLTGGSATDNFTNTYMKNSREDANPKYSDFVFGAPIIEENGKYPSQKDPILVTGLGVVNFTSLTVQNDTVLTASGGNIRNGLNASTAALHASTYFDFGHMTLKDTSGIGVANAANNISGGNLTVEGENTVESGQGSGLINISGISFADPNESRLTWIKNTTTEAGMVASDGTYFGKNQAFQVLTINPTISNASPITPFNFKGIEKATGKTFIGDNDITGKNSNGYGIMMPGSVIDYTVTDPVVDGKGFIEHNVAEVKKDNQPLTLSVWGTEEKGMKVQKGRLIIPNSTGILPTLTFTPEQTSGSWLYNTTVKSTKIGSTDEVIGEQSNSDPVDWTSKDGNYSYDVQVRYSNQVELAARNVILTETEASKLLTEADLNVYTQVEGRPFLTSTITDQLLEAIRKPLDEDQYSRMTKVQYIAGTAAVNPTNTMTQEVNVIVVKDGATIAKDRQDAIYAQDVTIRVLDIANVGTQDIFETDYSHAFAIDAKGAVSSVESTPNNYFSALQAVLPEDVPKDIPVTYAFTSSTETITKAITIHVIPSEANLVVLFEDEVGNSLHLPITFKRNINSTVDLTKEQEVIDAIAEIQGKNYVLETRPNPEIVTIVTGGSEVTYQFKGIIFIASAPDKIEFGTHVVKPTKQRINEPESMSGDLAIQDSRANRKPWVLTAKLDTPLNNGKDTVPGALRYVYKGKEIVLNAGAEEVAGHTNTDEKPYKVNSTWSASGDGLKLQTDIGAVKSSGDYTASITWELTDAP